MCVFCDIISGANIPAHKVYEDDKILVILDIAPVTVGHTLIIPKKHYANILEMPSEEFGPFMQDVQKVAKHLSNALNIEGFNMLANTGSVAGQTVNHLHIHIIPRHKDDKFKLVEKSDCKCDNEKILKMVQIKNKSL